MSAVFLFDQVLACTESATSAYLTASQFLSAPLGRPEKVKFILDCLRWIKNEPAHLSHPYDYCLVTQHLRCGDESYSRGR